MHNHTDAEIVSEFLGYYRMKLDRDNILRRQGDQWPNDLLFDFIYNDPHRCWKLISTIAEQNPDVEAMTFLGVTLSGLLREHPETIGIISREVLENNKLRELLKWISEDEHIPSNVWKQIKELSDVK